MKLTPEVTILSLSLAWGGSGDVAVLEMIGSAWGLDKHCFHNLIRLTHLVARRFSERQLILFAWRFPLCFLEGGRIHEGDTGLFPVEEFRDGEDLQARVLAV